MVVSCEVHDIYEAACSLQQLVEVLGNNGEMYRGTAFSIVGYDPEFLQIKSEEKIFQIDLTSIKNFTVL